ncbi:oligosaccharyl transferase, STT3 subunit [Thermococcus cleftensis]|uniref:dolichyl-phosphooligosaccharide-protein glycotransferase n=1 Tax=Thermococcus cleftensis (strain DSM 27260 / KACC 17922 / CL1) TaxID=163003 RepID=I3ZWL5_THECF|nr:STT3 domain-containing protein [Thermococcus cleftensis]AFL96099.1 oligosaccharyl transferase, STT3 subunit [Thermococcus cleftensis]
MVKTDVKEKRKKKKGEETSLSRYYSLFKAYGLPLLALLLAYLGFKLRNITSNYKTFLDPDTFFHYEMYKQAITEWIPQYFAYADPPAGIKATGYLGLYTVQAVFYKVTHALFGYTELQAFKVWPPFVGAMTVLAVYLLGRKLHSDWAGIWASAFMMFSYASFTKTMSGNNRGEGPFMMFFLYAVLFLLVYLDEKEWNWKKVLSAVMFLVTSVLYMGVWTGSVFGIEILLAFAFLTVTVAFIAGLEKFTIKFIKEFVPIQGLAIVLGIIIARTGFIGIGTFLLKRPFGLMGLFAVLIYAGLLIGLKRFLHFDYSRLEHRLGALLISGGVLVIFAGLLGLLNISALIRGAYQSTPLYQTVAELARTDINTIKAYYSIKSKDMLLFILSIVGFLVVLVKFINNLRKGNVSSYKNAFLVSYYISSVVLLALAVRFVFQASGAILLLAGIAIGEVFLFVENMKESLTTKALYAVLLILLFLPLPVMGAQYSKTLATNTAKAQGSVPADWVNTLTWLKENSHPLDSATSWWDYGYWIESSLLSNRRSSTDGGHAYDRRYLLADFFSHYGNESEQDFEAWELNYLIVWQQDIYKFNAISYLGGAIDYYEYGHVPMFQLVPMQYVKYANESGKTVVYLKTAEGDRQPVMTVDLARGQVIQGRGDIPYVLYLFGNYGLLAYHKIAFSNFVRLAFHIPYSFEPWDAQKLFANFKPVHNDGGVSTYEFRPFAVYRIDRFENGTWKAFYSTMGGGKLPLGEQRLRLWISAFGRDVKDATLVFEAYNGTELIKREVLAENLNVNHLNETPVEVSLFVPNATSYRFVLIQDGPVGVLNGEPRVDGRTANPSYILEEGQSGQLELKAAFRKDYDDVTLTLRASIVYYVAPNGKDIESDNFYLVPHQDIITYVPVKELSVREGDNVITARASMPSDVFDAYIEKLYQEYGKDKVVIVKKRVEPIFIAKKEYVIWEG